MHIRHRRTVAAIAVLSATTTALLALSESPASAGTGGGTLFCKSTTLQPPEQDAPFILSVTANPTGPKTPNGDTIPVNNATVTVTLPGASVGAFRAQANATGVGLTQGIVKLDATHATGTLQTTAASVSAPSQTITNYNATGGPGGTPIADPITFTIPNVNFGSVTTNGAHGQSVDISLAADSSGDGFIFSLAGGLAPTLGFGSLNNGFGGPGGDGFCFNDTTGAITPWAPSIASVALVDPTPVVTVLGSYGAVAGISNALQVTASDAGGAGIVPGSWTVSSGPTCAGGGGSATIGGTATGATVNFTAPNTATTCTIGVTVSDGVTTSSEAVLNVTVVAGDNLQQNISQQVNPGTLDLLACGSSTPDPASCSITMSPITLNGSDQSTTGNIHQVTVQDARGVPVGWSVTAQLAGDLVNSTYPSDPNGRINANLLKITPSCGKAAGNSNAVPTAGGAAQPLGSAAALCTATGGQNTGSFTVDGSLGLTVPSTVYSGTYQGTINFIVS
jgi:hypothetical protein